MSPLVRSYLKFPVVELAIVLLITGIVMVLGLELGFTERLAALVQIQYPGHDLADLGPGLLVLSTGLGIMTYRRWKDSECERERVVTATEERVKSEERYRSLVELSPDPVLVVRDMEIAYVNPSAVAFFGAKDASELCDRSLLELLPETLRATAPEWFAGVLATSTPTPPIEHLLQRLDGSVVQVETALVRTPFEGGWALQAVVRDLTARHAADAALARYQTLAENSQEVVFFSAPDGRIVDVNKAATLRYGYTVDEFRTMTVFDLRAPGVTSPTGGDLTHAPGDTARFDTVHALKDGTLMELSVTAQRVVIGNEEFVVTVGRDVTEKRRAVREIRDSEARYRSLVEMSPSAIIVHDPDNMIVSANQAALDLLHARSETDVIGHNAADFVHPDSRPIAAQDRARREREGSTPFTDIELLRVDGTAVAVQMATSLTTAANGGEAVQVVIQDVSNLKDEADVLRRTTEDTISAMARLAETRDPYTSGHQERVAAMAHRMAKHMGLPDATCETIRLAGIVHDIGKMNVPAEILSKPGRLTDAEFSLIKQHAERGYELLRPIQFPWPIAEIVREHHERLDGSGYPRGLRNGDICIEARVLAVADTVEAISAHRPYRPALGIGRAIEVIREGRGTLYDAACVDAAVELASTGDLLEQGRGALEAEWTPSAGAAGLHKAVAR